MPEGTPVTWNIFTQIADIQRVVHLLNAKADKLMSQQDEINQDVSELQAAVAAIAAEIAALENANPALDLSGLKAAVASVQALAPPAAP
jgi:peptidoglycan hydrolase CwlO-like protein